MFALLERIAAPELIAGFAVLVGILTAAWFGTKLRRKVGKKSEAESVSAFAWPMAASLLCAPVVYPWYLLWMLPFLRSRSTLPIIIWSVSILPTYYVWHLRAIGQPFIVPGWILLLEYGSVALAVVLVCLRRMREPRDADAKSE